jgi:hypothetical protein
MAGIWGNGEVALSDDPPGKLMVIDSMPEGALFVPHLGAERRRRADPSEDHAGDPDDPGGV